ncbi:MAG: hypothetical protein JWP72_900 [Massilia sp.]|nr:hypothetical protein [Massilia sp.]
MFRDKLNRSNLRDANSISMQIKRNEKNKPHCLIFFRQGGFFFSCPQG